MSRSDPSSDEAFWNDLITVMVPSAVEFTLPHTMRKWLKTHLTCRVIKIVRGRVQKTKF